ncbi:hypothetical protein [Plectonema radiosum]|nr:hypothetical protein [Plectonema radiosum]
MKAESGRYHLYISWACRTAIMRSLNCRLSQFVELSQRPLPAAAS